MRRVKVRRALVSVSDKTGIIEFVRALVDIGVEVVSSGGTAREIAAAGLPVTKVADVTGSPEILGGRVKTLHPKIHGGILADRRRDDHLRELEHHEIEPIDLVVCNLYPFERTVADPAIELDEAIEQIDVGGPAMVRAAAKNFHSVAVVVDPDRYASLLDELRDGNEISEETRRELALEAFAHTAAYDGAIVEYLRLGEEWPDSLLLTGRKALDLRYGENPHQSAAFYRTGEPPAGIAAADQIHGKELSYNNLLDTDAAWRLVLDLDAPAAAIIKHSNPCGVAVGGSIDDAYTRAFECDETSAFGGIVALNDVCTEAAASSIAHIFTEVVIAPDFEPAALEILQSKKNLRILRGAGEVGSQPEVRRVSGGLLLQSPDPRDAAEDAKVVTSAQPTDAQWDDLRFAWVVAKHVKSNAIVLASQ